MKIKKTVTSDVIAANRANAKKSTGPRRPEIVMMNALKHGLLSRNLTFQTEQEKQEFDELVHDLVAEYQPTGASEEILVEEFAIACWQLGRLYALGDQELERRRKTNAWVLGPFGERRALRRSSDTGGSGWTCLWSSWA
jgi:hypothetical protein